MPEVGEVRIGKSGERWVWTGTEWKLGSQVAQTPPEPEHPPPLETGHTEAAPRKKPGKAKHK